MLYVDKKDLNERLETIADLLGFNLDNVSFTRLEETINSGNIGGVTTYRRYESKKMTYKSYKTRNTSTSILDLKDGKNRINVEVNEFSVGNISIPRINIQIKNKDMDVDYVELTATSFSLQASVGKRMNGDTYVRYVSYEDPEYENCCLLPDAPFELRKFKAGEDQKTRYGVEKRFISLLPSATSPILAYRIFGGRDINDATLVDCGNDYIDDVIQSLLSNERCTNLFSHTFDVLEECIPGIVDYFSREFPFFRDTTDKMYEKKERKNNDYVDYLFSEISSPLLDLEEDKGKQKSYNS